MKLFFAVLLLVLYAAVQVAAEPELACIVQCKKDQGLSFEKCLDFCNDNPGTVPPSTAACITKCFTEQPSTPKKKACMNKCWADNPMSDAEASSPISSKLVWESYAKELFSYIKQGGDVKGLQLLRTPIPAVWNTDPHQLSDLCNRQSDWGVEYLWNGKLFSEQYISFLKNIKVSQQTGQPKPECKELDAANAAVVAAEEELDEARTRCAAAYTRRWAGRSGAPKYEDYEKQSCNYVSDAQFDYTQAMYRLRALQTTCGAGAGEVADAIRKFEEQSGKWDWQETFVNTLAAFYRKIATHNTDSFTISITKSSSSQKNLTSEWSWKQLETGKSGEFISSANVTKTHAFTTSEDNFKMDITAEGYYAVPVGPSASWFSTDVVRKYKNGPFIDTTKKYFGKDGSLSMKPKVIHMLYKPTIDLFLSQSDAEYMTTMKGSVKVGPFSVDVSKITMKPVKEQSSGDEKIYKVSFTPEDDAPLVVAMENEFL
jgi:hypothetical protein